MRKVIGVQVERERNEVVLLISDKSEQRYSRKQFPENFIKWQSTSRIAMFKKLREGGSEAIKSQPAHLPVIATIGEGFLPLNLAYKGIGPLPKGELLGEFTELFESVVADADPDNWSESLQRRAEAAKKLYSNPSNFDPWLLGGLEIFEGRTYTNLKSTPLASIIYSGEAPDFPSYQFNTAVEFVGGSNEHYRFLLSARKLFAFDSFHVEQDEYPFGYLFHVIEIFDKTPFSRKQ